MSSARPPAPYSAEPLLPGRHANADAHAKTHADEHAHGGGPMGHANGPFDMPMGRSMDMPMGRSMNMPMGRPMDMPMPGQGPGNFGQGPCPQGDCGGMMPPTRHDARLGREPGS